MVAVGAVSVEGGTYEGLFYRPTVLAEVTLDAARLDRRDVRPGRARGQVRLDDEAVALANKSEYGLAAGVYSRSISRGSPSPTASGRAWST